MTLRSSVPRSVRVQTGQVPIFRADLALEQLDNFKIDDSFGSLVRSAESNWLDSLIVEHNNEDSDFPWMILPHG